MSGHLSPIQLDSYRPLRELVCETIRQAIVDGVFSPGERLMEIQLADEMGVSRTPVREAIRKLELEGFVVMIPRRGTYVADISIKDMLPSASAMRSWKPCSACWWKLGSISKTETSKKL